MVGVSVVFDYDGNFDRARVVEVAQSARKMFEGMPGLRFKAFTLDDKRQRAMNFYVWDSREAAEAFFTDDLREKVTGLYGVPPTVSYLEIAEFAGQFIATQRRTSSKARGMSPTAGTGMHGARDNQPFSLQPGSDLGAWPQSYD